jgi:hypothetical protein
MDGTEKLYDDLDVMAAMAAEMDEYLRSDVLFWPLRNSDLPRLTLGGYLMRQHRLLELRDLLDAEAQERLHDTIHQFQSALSEKIVRSEEKAHEEAGARLRQWQQYLREVKEGVEIAYYASAVDTRAMLEALVAQLRISPYELDQEVPRQLATLDRELSRYWEPGNFVWPVEWKPAYPQNEYWWLFGRPRDKEK